MSGDADCSLGLHCKNSFNFFGFFPRGIDRPMQEGTPMEFGRTFYFLHLLNCNFYQI